MDDDLKTARNWPTLIRSAAILILIESFKER